MKKALFVTTILFACCTSLMAQQAKIGYFSTQAVLAADATYQAAMQAVAKSRQQATVELEAAQQEFTEKYELFLEQQSMLDAAIKEKRQAELREMLERNEQFKRDSQQRLKTAEDEALAPALQRISNAVQKVAGQQEYLMIVDTDSKACPYINPAYSENITSKLK